MNSMNSMNRLRRVAWPVGIVVGLGFVVVVNGVMISVALSNPSAPASLDHWAESLVWEDELEQRERSAALGWSLREVSRDDQGGLELYIVDREGGALQGAQGSLRIERADDSSRDQAYELSELGGGRYRSVRAVPETGFFQVELDLIRLTRGREEHFVVRWTVDLGELGAREPAETGG